LLEPIATLPEDWNYEQAIATVAEIVGDLESGDLDLGDAFAQFEIAVERLQECEQFLTERQAQVDLAITTLED
jgi:exodeoxyribonuclease VII small subunit